MLRGWTYYGKISWYLEARRFGLRLFQSLWNLTGSILCLWNLALGLLFLKYLEILSSTYLSAKSIQMDISANNSREHHKVDVVFSIRQAFSPRMGEWVTRYVASLDPGANVYPWGRIVSCGAKLRVSGYKLPRKLSWIPRWIYGL